MRISDWSSDVCSSDLKWFVNGRAICRYGIRRGERGSDRRISGATGRSRVARSGLMPHGDAVGEWVMNLSRKIIVAGKVAASVTGVNKVVKLFQIVSPESIAAVTPPAPVDDASNPVSPKHRKSVV